MENFLFFMSKLKRVRWRATQDWSEVAVYTTLKWARWRHYASAPPTCKGILGDWSGTDQSKKISIFFQRECDGAPKSGEKWARSLDENFSKCQFEKKNFAGGP